MRIHPQTLLFIFRVTPGGTCLVTSFLAVAPAILSLVMSLIAASRGVPSDRHAAHKVHGEVPGDRSILSGRVQSSSQRWMKVDDLQCLWVTH
jgi:hypothetical protein